MVVIEEVVKRAQKGDLDAKKRLRDSLFDYDEEKLSPKEQIRLLKEAAEFDDGIAQFQLAIRYKKGDGVEKNLDLYLRLLRDSAYENVAEAQSELASCYYSGIIVEQDYKQAFDLFSLAAEQGYKYGQLGLGMMYEFGQYVSIDYIEAEKWYKKAALQNSHAAQLFLGNLYYDVFKDKKRAIKWFIEAAKNGDKLAIVKLKELKIIE